MRPLTPDQLLTATGGFFGRARARPAYPEPQAAPAQPDVDAVFASMDDRMAQMDDQMNKIFGQFSGGSSKDIVV